MPPVAEPVADAAFAAPSSAAPTREPGIAAITSVRRPTFRPRRRSEILNRIVNVIIAGTALLILSPLLIVLGVIVMLTSPGPAIYVQTRVGVDRRRARRPVDLGTDRRAHDVGGRPFHIYKFRSMVANAERSGAVWARRGDARVTRLGRIMRLTRLDELPQLYNVVLGDMNIVGPRPERPSIFGRLREAIDEYPQRQLGRPGITGWAQVNHCYDTCVDDVRVKVRYDLEYLGRQGLLEDLRIMVRTIGVMLLARGT